MPLRKKFECSWVWIVKIYNHQNKSPDDLKIEIETWENSRAMSDPHTQTVDLPMPIRIIPYGITLVFGGLAALAVLLGGWWILMAYVLGIILPAAADLIVALNQDNPDITTPDHKLVWHRGLIMIWPPLQFCLLFGAIPYVTHSADITAWQAILLFGFLSIVMATLGIVFAHELMHRQSRLERWLGDVLMAMVLYGHFRTEHLHVHHRYVGTPRDTVSARLGEDIYSFFFRVLPGSFISALQVEAERQQRRNRSPWHYSNPFWIYAGLQILFLTLSALLGGVMGVGLFVLQAFFAVLYLESIDYIEHYGLERRQLENGSYEPVKPHHSWNSEHTVTNYLLINLPRHSDHHSNPGLRYPLLRTYPRDEAPHMPFPYPIMLIMALIPPLWMAVMNAEVAKWRKQFYPDVGDWDRGKNVLPQS
jgi:alkane 1-monooxygenase